MDASRFRPSPGWLMRVGAASIAIIVTACGSAGAASGLPAHPDALARADCATVGRALGSPPGHEQPWARRVEKSPASGIVPLDAAVHRLAITLRGHDPAAVDHAYSAVVATCARLGLWQTYHAPAQTAARR